MPETEPTGPVPEAAALVADPIEAKYLAIKAERDKLLVDSHDQFAQEEQALLPVLARLNQLQTARKAVDETVNRYNHTLNTLFELLPEAAQQRIRPTPTPAEPTGGEPRTPRGTGTGKASTSNKRS